MTRQEQNVMWRDLWDLSIYSDHDMPCHLFAHHLNVPWIQVTHNNKVKGHAVQFAPNLHLRVLHAVYYIYIKKQTWSCTVLINTHDVYWWSARSASSCTVTLRIGSNHPFIPSSSSIIGMLTCLEHIEAGDWENGYGKRDARYKCLQVEQ